MPKEFNIGPWHFDRREYRGTTGVRFPYHISRTPTELFVPTVKFQWRKVNVPIPWIFSLEPIQRGNGRGNGWYRDDVTKLRGIGIFIYKNFAEPDRHVLKSEWGEGFNFGYNRSVMRRGSGVLLTFGWGDLHIKTKTNAVLQNGQNDSMSNYWYFTLKPKWLWLSLPVPKISFGKKRIII